jgi:hypothetical protein
MLLGDLLAKVERSGADGRAAAMLGNLALLTEVAAAAAEDGDDPDS